MVGFSEESPVDVDAEYFLLFEGAKWRHLTTARVIDRFTLHVVIPGRPDLYHSILEPAWPREPTRLYSKMSKLCRYNDMNHSS